MQVTTSEDDREWLQGLGLAALALMELSRVGLGLTDR